MKHWLLSVLLMVCSTVSAQITLVKDGKSNARIIVQDKMPNSKTSAELLQHFLYHISKSRLPIEYDKTSRKGDILIGGQTPQTVTEDGFSISSQNGILRIQEKKKELYMELSLYWNNIWESIIGERMNILLLLKRR